LWSSGSGPGRSGRGEALFLKSKVLNMEVSAFIPEILPLEVIRAL